MKLSLSELRIRKAANRAFNQNGNKRRSFALRPHPANLWSLACHQIIFRS